MSHQSFVKSTGVIPDGYILTYRQADGYWAPRKAPDAGWVTALDLDLTAQGTQTLSTDTNYTIGGITFTKVNSANDASATTLNSSGLTFQPASATDYNASTRTLPLVFVKFSNFIPNFDLGMDVRVTVYNSALNNSGNYDNAVMAVDTNNTDFAVVLKRGTGTNGQGFQSLFNRSATNVSGFIDSGAAPSATNDTMVIEVYNLGHFEGFATYDGDYNAGFPVPSAFNAHKGYAPAVGIRNNTDLTTANLGFSLGAQRAGSGTSLTVRFARIKVEYRNGPATAQNVALATSTTPGLVSIGGDLGGTAMAPTVTKLNGFSINNTPPTDGYTLVWSQVDGYWVPRQGTVSRYTPTDANTILNWKFNETAAPYLNSGTGSALSLTTFSGTPLPFTGLFGKTVGLSATTLTTGNTALNEPTGNSLSVSVWVKPFTFPSNAVIFNKSYRNNNTWATPFATIYLSLTTAGDGTWGPAIVISGAITQPTIGGLYRIPPHTWTLISYTYDGSNLRSYFNGALALTTPVVGTIDWGTHGPWDVGGISNASQGQQWNGFIDDLRIENGVRSQAYFEEMYKRGIGQPD